MGKHQEGQWWSDGKRIEVVSSYLVLGKPPLVEAITGVPASTIRRWRTEPWWDELVAQIQVEGDVELDAKLAARVSKVLDIVDDRLVNGDFFFDPKTKQFLRKPTSLKETWQVGKEMVDLRLILRRQPKEQTSQEAVGDILKGLAKEFASMARKKMKDVDGEIIENAVESELHPGLQTGSSDGESETKAIAASPEPSSLPDDEKGQSSSVR